MTHYEERLDRDVARIREEIAAVAGQVRKALAESVHALLAGDRERAYRVVLGDNPINRRVRGIDRRCHAFVARHLPSAGHLRFISSTLRLNVEMERIGDYAASIAREAVQLTEPPSAALARDIELMAEQTGALLDASMQAFLEGNAELARATKTAAYGIERTYESVFSDLLETGEKGDCPLRDLFALLVVYNRLSRVADQSKNICEDAIFAATGETKQPKVYRVLFADAHNDCASQIAEVIARKAFPNSGDFDSAGWDPASSIEPALAGFLEHMGYSIEAARPSSLATTVHELNDYHVIVSINGDVTPHIPAAPFHTILLNWDVGACPDRFDDDSSRARLEEICRLLATRIEDLMLELRGEEAD